MSIHANSSQPPHPTPKNNRKPNFFIIGAPKCGTTSMQAWLSEHSLIYMATGEPYYFADDCTIGWIKNLTDYQALFALADDSHIAVGEKSVRHLFSQNAVASILAYNADARFIVMLRNPIDMAYSWHGHLLSKGRENTHDFQIAWQLQKERRAGKHIPHFCTDHRVLDYGAFCSLGEQVQRLYKQVPAERVHIIFFDDLIQNSRQIYVQVLNFLGVADDNRQDFNTYNSAQQNRSYFLRYLLLWLKNWLECILYNLYKPDSKWHDNIVKIKAKLGIKRRIKIDLLVNSIMDNIVQKNTKPQQQQKPMSAFMRQTLIAYFSKDIALLSQITKRNLDHWLHK